MAALEFIGVAVALTVALFLVSIYSDERCKDRRRGFEAGDFADYFDGLGLARSQVVAVYRRLQGFFVIEGMPIFPADGIEETCGLDGAYRLDDLVAELLGELGSERSDGEIRAALAREKPRDIAGLMRALAALVAQPGADTGDGGGA